MSLLKQAGVFCFATLVSLNTGGCKKEEAPEKTTHERLPNGSVRLTGASESYVKVEIAKAPDHMSGHDLVARVSFDERHLAALGPPVQGRVASVNVVVGDHVKKDQVLLTIHAPDIASARAQVEEAKTGRQLAERVAQRAAMLVQQGAGSDAERLQSEAALLQARSEEQRAVASLQAIGGASGSSDYQLRSPIEGIVVARKVAVGTEVHTDQDDPIITVADLSTVWVVADVFEQDMARVHVGDSASVDIVSLPDKHFDGKITWVSNTVDSATRVAPARMELPNPNLDLRPGMFATMHVSGLNEAAVEIPISAVLARRDQFFVFLRNADGTYSQKEVRPGEQYGQHIAILDGLHPGDPVVTEGAILLDAEANEAL